MYCNRKQKDSVQILYHLQAYQGRQGNRCIPEAKVPGEIVCLLIVNSLSVMFSVGYHII
jgi:hypothetical protein